MLGRTTVELASCFDIRVFYLPKPKASELYSTVLLMLRFWLRFFLSARRALMSSDCLLMSYFTICFVLTAFCLLIVIWS